MAVVNWDGSKLETASGPSFRPGPESRNDGVLLML